MSSHQIDRFSNYVLNTHKIVITLLIHHDWDWIVKYDSNSSLRWANGEIAINSMR